MGKYKYCGEEKLCWYCGLPLSKTGKGVQAHHVKGKKVSSEKVLVHRRCHKIIHGQVSEDD